MSAELKASRQDANLILTLSNPGVQNALEADMIAAALETLSTAERDSSIRCVILTGTDKYFCASANVYRRLESRAQERSEQVEFIDMLHNLIEVIRAFPKPVIAAVEGGASGSGLSLMLACDLIVAGASSVFSMSGVQSGRIPDGGTSWFLTHALPRQLANEIMLEGKAISAARLHQAGIINRLASDHRVLDAALAWADELAALDPDTLEQVKFLLHEAGQNTLPQQLKAERQAFIEVLHQPGKANNWSNKAQE
ncbi:MAG: enoyl-CoA hydratase family protein [Pseudomonadota bacterium]